MSQKVRISGVKIVGTPYLGQVNGVDTWSASSTEIMNWLSDGWRGLYNNFRADHVHNTNTALTKSQYRHSEPHKLALPTSVLQGIKYLERGDWIGALRRIKTTKSGRAPRFKRLKDGRSFVVLGSGYTFVRQLSKRRAELTITGQNPAAFRGCVGAPSRWSVKIRFRLSQEIRNFTSVRVNLARGTMVFVNAPIPIERLSTGSVIGIDVGVTHTLSTSNDEHFNIPRPTKTQDARYLKLQRKLARQDRVNQERVGRAGKFASKRRQRTVALMSVAAAKQARRRSDWVDKVTTQLVREHDFISLELISSKSLSRNGRGKRGLNRGILSSCWGQFQTTLTYKAALAGVQLAWVNPAYTSQTCNACGHIARENRESQAAFKCIKCGHAANADINAARNILARGLEALNGAGQALERGAQISPESDTQVSLSGASVEPLTLEAEAA